MARLPTIKQPMRPVVEVMQPAAPTRSMADLPPSAGYLQGEIERLPVAGPILGDEEFPVLQEGQAKRGSTRSLLKRIREEANDVAENAAKLAVEGGGSGRHSLVRSFNRARPLASLDGSETVGVVREGEFFRVPTSLLTGGGSGGDADTLNGHAGAYFLDWANFTGVPTEFPPSAHTHAQSDVADLVTDLAAKAPLASPALTGNPTAPTQAAGNNSTRIATTAYTDAAIAALIASAPGVLDTLDEIAAALGDDPNFAATMTTALAGKLAKSSNLSDLTDSAAARTNLGLVIGTDVAAQSHVGSGGSAHADVVAAGASGFMTGADKTKLDLFPSTAAETGSLLRANGSTFAKTSASYPSSVGAGAVLIGGTSTDSVQALALVTTATRYLANTGASNIPKWDQINLTNGVTGTLPVANGGTGYAGGTIPTTTPTPTAVSGSFTSASGTLYVLQIGKIAIGHGVATITTAGTGDTGINITMPFTAAMECSVSAEYKNGLNRKMARIIGSSSVLRIYVNDGGTAGAVPTGDYAFSFICVTT